MQPESFINLNEKTVVELIKLARTRLVYVAPGLTETIANAIDETWQRIGVDNVTIVLDVDPEVCRLGYGTIEGLTLMRKAAQRRETLVCYHQEGVRIGLLISDDTTLVYSPIPLLVEAGSTKPSHPNAIRLNAPPAQVAKDVGLQPGHMGVLERTFGLDSVTAADVDEVQEDLRQNPPQAFDLARQVRVFNSRFEFVELSLEGCYISRKTAIIPSELMGLANSEDMKNRLRSSFKIIGDEDVFDEKDDMSEKYLRDQRKKIEDEFLCSIKGYGKAILRENKDEFDKRVQELKRDVEDFKKQVHAKLKDVMEQNASNLVTNLLPLVKQSPPARWRKFLGSNPTEPSIRKRLQHEIDQAFGDVKNLVKAMRIEVVFKGVTYESIRNKSFIEATKSAFPGLDVFHEEYDVARLKKEEENLKWTNIQKD